MTERYKCSCGAYITEYISTKENGETTLTGWYHYIDNTELNMVGVVATAEILILIKQCNVLIEFDCAPMIETLIELQNSDGGWSFSSNIHNSAAEPTARAIQALLLWEELLSDKHKQAILNGIQWLVKHRNSQSLWGPINKKEKNGYLYFSCVVLQALYVLLQRRLNFVTSELIDEIESIVNDSITSIFNCFSNNDTQCGWGITTDKRPTLFHTAYVIYTLAMVEPTVMKKHAVLKSMEYLKDQFLRNRQRPIWGNIVNVGETEIYQYKALRLTYTHSVDVYVMLALLQDDANMSLEEVASCSLYFIKCAEKTDWRYKDYVTCWRLFDVMLLCDFYSKTLEKKSLKSMNHFKIALTFAGETRDLVESIANELSEKLDRKEILYDKYHEAEFARPQLDVYLQKLYHDCSDLIVVFICDNYSQKRWCGVEWRSIRDILNNFDFERIMYVKATETSIRNIELPGFYASEDGYIDANVHTPKEVADLIYSRYESMS